jgi:GR25 family glycosyltransferase involved in LPS biosynthesis
MKYYVYILSIKHSERREHVENLSKKLINKGFEEVEIIDAFYWKECDVLSILNELKIELRTYNISQAQVACFLTHRKAWDIISSKNTEGIHIILEDDMDIPEDFSMNDIENVYNSIYKENYDSIFLYKHPEQASKPSNLVCYNEYLLKHYFQWGFCAYSIQPNLAKELIEFVKHIDCPVDNQIQTQLIEKYKKDRVFYTVKDFFCNLGFVAGNTYYGEYKFKSNIWG